MKYTLPCYSYDDVNGYSYFVYYLPDGLSCELLSLRSWGNVTIARFKVKRLKNSHI